eukprot:1811221-Prymnesium_polylepis.1
MEVCGGSCVPRPHERSLGGRVRVYDAGVISSLHIFTYRGTAGECIARHRPRAPPSAIGHFHLLLDAAFVATWVGPAAQVGERLV